MKLSLFSLIIFAVSSVSSLFGATVYVDGSVTTAFSTAYNVATRGVGTGVDTVYKSLAQANAVASPGVTIVVRGGVYTDPIAPGVSGTAVAPIIYKGATNENVFLKASTAIVFSSRNYIVVDGFRAEDTRWLEANNSHHNVIQNCVFKRSPATGTTGNVRFVKSHFNRVLKNHIESGADNLLFIDSNNNLAEGNTILEASHSIFGIRCGDGNVIRGNYLANTQQKIGEVYDCGADTSAVANSFDSTSRNVIEENIFAGTVKYYSSSGGNGIQYAGQKGIIRNNVFYDCNIGLSMAYYADEGQFNYDNRVYNNTFYNNAGAGIASTSGSQHNVFKNNLLAANKGCLPDCFGVSPGQFIYRVNPGQFASFVANNFFYTAPGQPVIEEEFGGGYTIAQASARFPGVFANTYELEPQFTDAARNDFSLKTTSPLIDKGQFLTTTRVAGSGTVVPVVDALYFFDGAGWAENRDVVKFQGQTTTARVVAIDALANTVTLDRAVTWTAGQGVSLDFNGAAPEIGAYETAAVATPVLGAPANITATAGQTMVSGVSTVTVRWNAASGAISYKVRRMQANIGTWVDVATLSATTTTFSHAVTGSANYTFHYQVVAVDGNGQTAASSIVSVAPISPMPKNVVATALVAAEVQLSWRDDSADESGFKIEMWNYPTQTWVQVGSVGAGVTTVRLTAALSKAIYSFRVRAYNSSWQTLPSSFVTVTTL